MLVAFITRGSAAAFAVCLLGFAACAPAPDGGPRGETPPTHPADGLAELLGVPPPRPDPIRTRIEAAVTHVRSRPVHTDDAFWVVFHAVLGLGPDLELVDRSSGRRVNALRYMLDAGPMPGLIFAATPHGLDVIMNTPNVGQGHQDQFVAEMGQWGTPLGERVTLAGKNYTFEHFVRHSQMRARVVVHKDPNQNQELSWAVPLLAQYRGTGIQWENAHKEKLKFEDLVRYELDAEVERAACGGTHRMFGLTWAYHYHLIGGGKDEGVWREVAEKNRRYRDIARKLHLADGSLSAKYFVNTPLAPRRPPLGGADGSFGSSPRPGHSRERFQKINATGHLLEWMALALPDDELREPWVTDAVSALCIMLIDLEDESYGAAIYHAIHGLYIYYARVYGFGTFVPQKLLVPLPPGWKQPQRG